jgi:hypothetical protein
VLVHLPFYSPSDGARELSERMTMHACRFPSRCLWSPPREPATSPPAARMRAWNGAQADASLAALSLPR